MQINLPQFRESIICMDGEIVRPRVRTMAQWQELFGKADGLLFKDDAEDKYWCPPMIVEENGQIMMPLKVALPIWNMDATVEITAPHSVGFYWESIFYVIACIDSDDRATKHVLPCPSSDGANVDAWIDRMDDTNVYLRRRTGGRFDNASYDDGLLSRGYMTLWRLI